MSITCNTCLFLTFPVNLPQLFASTLAFDVISRHRQLTMHTDFCVIIADNYRKEVLCNRSLLKRGYYHFFFLDWNVLLSIFHVTARLFLYGAGGIYFRQYSQQFSYLSLNCILSSTKAFDIISKLEYFVRSSWCVWGR